MPSIGAIEKGLKAKFTGAVVDELLAAHKEAKKNYYLGGLRLSAVKAVAFVRRRTGCLRKQ
jgi:hypothetical protein